MARPLVEQHGHALYVGIPDTGLPIDGDQDRIVQVLVNLLTNAARYTPAGRDLALTSDCVDGCVEIACEDNGPGVPAEHGADDLRAVHPGAAIDRAAAGRARSRPDAGAQPHRAARRDAFATSRSSRTAAGLLSAFRSPRAAVADEPASAPTENVVTPRRVLLVDDNVDGLDMMRAGARNEGTRGAIGAATATPP